MRTLLTSCATLLLGVVAGVLVERWWLSPLTGDGETAGDGAERSFPPRLPDPPSATAPASGADPGVRGSEDPSDRLQTVLEVPTQFGRYAALYQAAGAADAAGIRGLILAAHDVPVPLERQAFLSILYRRYAELDADAAVDLILDSRYPEPSAYLSAVFRAWALMDLEAAVARAATLVPWLKEMAAQALLTTEAMRDSASGAELARTLGVGHEFEQLRAQRDLAGLPGSDPAADWAALTAGGVEMRDWSGYLGVAQQWVQTDARSAVEAAQALPLSQLRQMVLDHALGIWARIEGEAAVEWALAQPAGRLRTEAVQIALESYARADPTRALALAERLEPGEHAAALRQIVMRWAETDPTGAAQWVAGVPDAELAATLAGNVAMVYAMTDAPAALRWAESLSPEVSAQAVPVVLQSMAHSDPEQAAERAAALTSETRREAVRQVASTWAQTDPAAALRWLEDNADPATRGQSQSDILSTWVQYDAAAAMRSHERMRDPAARDTAALRMLQALSHQAGQAGQVEALYGRIRDPNVKQRAASSLYAQWAKTRPARAEFYRQEAERLADAAQN